jgi:hypothetical protein
VWLGIGQRAAARRRLRRAAVTMSAVFMLSVGSTLLLVTLRGRSLTIGKPEQPSQTITSASNLPVSNSADIETHQPPQEAPIALGTAPQVPPSEPYGRRDTQDSLGGDEPRQRPESVITAANPPLSNTVEKEAQQPPQGVPTTLAAAPLAPPNEPHQRDTEDSLGRGEPKHPSQNAITISNLPVSNSAENDAHQLPPGVPTTLATAPQLPSTAGDGSLRPELTSAEGNSDDDHLRPATARQGATVPTWGAAGNAARREEPQAKHSHHGSLVSVRRKRTTPTGGAGSFVVADSSTKNGASSGRATPDERQATGPSVQRWPTADEPFVGVGTMRSAIRR